MKKRISLLLMILLYVGSGINHFIHTRFYVAIVPCYLPYPLELVYISGVCEVLLGLLLIPYRTRKAAALLIIAMLIVFLIVHVQMILDVYLLRGWLFWIAVIRLPLQFVLIGWAWTISKFKVQDSKFKG